MMWNRRDVWYIKTRFTYSNTGATRSYEAWPYSCSWKITLLTEFISLFGSSKTIYSWNSVRKGEEKQNNNKLGMHMFRFFHWLTMFLPLPNESYLLPFLFFMHYYSTYWCREKKWKATLAHRFVELLHKKTGKLTRLYTQNIDGRYFWTWKEKLSTTYLKGYNVDMLYDSSRTSTFPQMKYLSNFFFMLVNKTYGWKTYIMFMYLRTWFSMFTSGKNCCSTWVYRSGILWKLWFICQLWCVLWRC